MTLAEIDAKIAADWREKKRAAAPDVRWSGTNVVVPGLLSPAPHAALTILAVQPDFAGDGPLTRARS